MRGYAIPIQHHDDTYAMESAVTKAKSKANTVYRESFHQTMQRMYLHARRNIATK